jgi:REP element-mobilizing transposase RayT
MASSPRPRPNPLRAPWHDYRAPRWYFITFNTYHRRPHFGAINHTGVKLSLLGHLAHNEWLRTMQLTPYASFDAFVVMPDHMHVLVGLLPDQWHTSGNPRSVCLVLQLFKASVVRQARRAGLLDRAEPLWQRSFHDSMVRDAEAISRIRTYIDRNPLAAARERLRCRRADDITPPRSAPSAHPP